MNLQLLCDQASAAYQRGNLPAAERLCLLIFEADPLNYTACSLLGLLRFQQSRGAEALKLMRAALMTRPNSPRALSNFGLMLRALGHFDEALSIYNKILSISPEFAEAHFNRAVVLSDLKRFGESLASYDRALTINPRHTEAHYNRGIALAELKRFDEALESYNKALEIKPTFTAALSNRANALWEMKNYDEALASYDMALVLDPNQAENHYNRGVILSELRRHRDALTCFQRAVELRPDFALALVGRGDALMAIERFDEALANYDVALTLGPIPLRARLNRGVTLWYLKRFEEALACYNQTLQDNPGHAEALNYRGLVLCDMGRHQASLQDFDSAIAVKPGFAEAYNNRGITLSEMGLHHAALTSYQEALTLSPNFAEVQMNMGITHLRLGEFEQGWERYEWRWKNEKLRLSARVFAKPQWGGEESLSGKTILLHNEQGLGDALQFCRYARHVSNLGARVVLEVQKPLVSLLSSVEGVSQVVARGDALPSFDLHCPLLSLPLAFKTRMDSIPVSARYISCNPDKVRDWQVTLGERKKFRIGLTWSGNAAQKSDHKRSIALHEFVKMLPAGFEYVSLQKDVRDQDRKALALRPDILQLGESLNDFSDTAAICELMDLVVTVCTSTAHVAAAIGKPVWILLSSNPCWRWLLERTDSPWYPSVTLYRQDRPGDWESVFARVRADLSEISP